MTKTNPRRRPATEADVRKAWEEGVNVGVRKAWEEGVNVGVRNAAALILTVLVVNTAWPNRSRRYGSRSANYQRRSPKA